MLWDEGAQHLMESHVVSCRTCVSGMGRAICKFLPYLRNYSDTTLKCDLNVQNTR